MHQVFIKFLGWLILELSRYYTRLSLGEVPKVAFTDSSSIPVVFSGGRVLCDVNAPLSTIVISNGCEFTGRIVARRVIILGRFDGILITHEAVVSGYCKANNSLCKNLEITSTGKLFGDITFDPNNLVIEKGASVNAELDAEEDIDLSMYGIIIVPITHAVTEPSSVAMQTVDQVAVQPDEKDEKDNDAENEVESWLTSKT